MMPLLGAHCLGTVLWNTAGNAARPVGHQSQWLLDLLRKLGSLLQSSFMLVG